MSLDNIEAQRVFGAPSTYEHYSSFGSLLDKSGTKEFGQTYRHPKGIHPNMDGTVMLRAPGGTEFIPFVVFGGQYYPYSFEMIGSTTNNGTTTVTSAVAFWG